MAQRVVETGFDGALAFTSSPGNLGGREVVDVAQHDGDAVVGIQTRKGLMEPVALVQAGDGIRSGEVGRIGEDDRPDRPPAYSRAALIDQDAVEPGVHSIRVA